MRVIRVLPLADWLALLTFFTGWIGYVRFAKTRAQHRPSVLAAISISPTPAKPRVVSGTSLDPYTRKARHCSSTS